MLMTMMLMMNERRESDDDNDDDDDADDDDAAADDDDDARTVVSDANCAALSDANCVVLSDAAALADFPDLYTIPIKSRPSRLSRPSWPFSSIDPGSSLTLIMLILRRWSEPLDVDSGRCSVTLIRFDNFGPGIYACPTFSNEGCRILPRILPHDSSRRRSKATCCHSFRDVKIRTNFFKRSSCL